MGLAIRGAPARHGRPPAGPARSGGSLRAPLSHTTQASRSNAREGGFLSRGRGRFPAQGSNVVRGHADRSPVRDGMVPEPSADASLADGLNGEEVPAGGAPSLSGWPSLGTSALLWDRWRKVILK